MRGAANEQPPLVRDPALCAEVARDMGGIVSRPPAAVVRPESVEDVVRTIRWCNTQGLTVVARGQGHTAFGQSQAAGGVVIDMRSLARVHAVAADHIVVDAGITWRKVLLETTARGRTPPVLTAFQGLSVGGTLSVGGLSGAAYNRGAQVDHVLSLDVVTGEGRLVTCSRERERELYDAVLGGLGQCAIIVQATLRLVPAPDRVHHATLSYRDEAQFLDALALLAKRQELDGVSATIYPEYDEGPRYDLNAFSFQRGAARPPIDHLLRGIRSRARVDTDHRYLDFYLQVDRLIDQLEAGSGWSDRVHPWFDAFVPESQLRRWLADVMPSLHAEDVGPPALGPLGQVHLFPLLRSRLGQPLLRVPDEEWVYLFDILSSSHDAAAADYKTRMLARNRRLYDRARELGGRHYPIAAIPLGPADWATHFGPVFSAFQQLKRRHDPARLLTPGPAIFEATLCAVDERSYAR